METTVSTVESTLCPISTNTLTTGTVSDVINSFEQSSFTTFGHGSGSLNRKGNSTSFPSNLTRISDPPIVVPENEPRVVAVRIEEPPPESPSSYAEMSPIPPPPMFSTATNTFGNDNHSLHSRFGFNSGN